jgi:hypothetical protein
MTQSLRTLAKELGISAAYLSMMVNGKRPWNPNIHARYLELVNTVNSRVNTGDNVAQRQSGRFFEVEDLSAEGGNDRIRTYDLALMKRPLCR